MKKTFICVNYYTAGETSSEYKNVSVKNLKTGKIDSIRASLKV